MEELYFRNKTEDVLWQIIQFCRKQEKDCPGKGHEALLDFRNDIPEQLYEQLKLCIDNPEAEINFIKNGK
jgi:hypothetical protein